MTHKMHLIMSAGRHSTGKCIYPQGLWGSVQMEQLLGGDHSVCVIPLPPKSWLSNMTSKESWGEALTACNALGVFLSHTVAVLYNFRILFDD